MMTQFAVVGNGVEHPLLDRVAPATARAIGAGIGEQQRDPTLGDLIRRDTSAIGPGPRAVPSPSAASSWLHASQ